MMNSLTMRSRKKSKFLETDENEHTTAPNVWDTAKAVLRGKFIAIQAYLKKTEKSQINNLTIYLQELEEQQQRKPRVSKRKEIIKILAELKTHTHTHTHTQTNSKDQ